MKPLNNIQKIRWERNISLRKLSKLSGVSHTEIAMLENIIKDCRDDSPFLIYKYSTNWLFDWILLFELISIKISHISALNRHDNMV